MTNKRSFGKFSVEQIIKNAACGLFCFEINSRSEYNRLKQEAIKVDSELVKKWDVCVGKWGFPIYLTKAGQFINKPYALHRDYTIVKLNDIEFNLPADNTTYIHYRVVNYEQNRDITDEENWVLTPDGRLAVNEYGDLVGRTYAKAIDVREEELHDLLYVLRTNMTSITRYVRHNKKDHPGLTMKEFKEQDQEYKELAEKAVTNILEYVNSRSWNGDDTNG